MKKVLGTVGFVGLLGAGVVSGMGAGCPDKKECKGLVELTLETYKKEKPLMIPWFKKKFTVEDKGVAEKLQAQLMADDPRIITKETAKQITFTGKDEVAEEGDAVKITATYNKKDVGIYIKEKAAPVGVKAVRKLTDKYKNDSPLEVKGIAGKKAQDDDATTAILTLLQAADPQFPKGEGGVSFESEQLKLDTPATVKASYKGETVSFFVKAVKVVA